MNDEVGAAGGYRLPPPELLALADAPPTPAVSPSPDGTRLLLMERNGYPPIREAARDELRLAQVYVNPSNASPARLPFTFRGLRLRRTDGSDSWGDVQGLPAGETRIFSVGWSPDSAHVAFCLIHERGVDLWLADADTRRVRRLIPNRVNALCGFPYTWSAAGDRLFCKVFPSRVTPPAARPEVPSGPIVKEAVDEPNPTYVYQDLLRDERDADLLERYLHTQLVSISLGGRRVKIGPVSMVVHTQPSPDGNYLLVEHIERPFSCNVPIVRFPRRFEVWSPDGQERLEVGYLLLDENRPIGRDGTRPGPREFTWRANEPATLCWVEAIDGGDHRRRCETRDAVFTLPAPFDGKPSQLIKLGFRFEQVWWSTVGFALVEEGWWKTRRRRVWVVREGRGEPTTELVFDLLSEDRYADPGDPMTLAGCGGSKVICVLDDSNAILLAGTGAGPEGDVPFVDSLDLASHKTTRIWRSKPPHFEAPLALLGKGQNLLIGRESAGEPRDYFAVSIAGGGEAVRLTALPHPYPQLKGARRELLEYQRADGIRLTAWLHTPPGYQPSTGPLPVLMWAYPREYKSESAAGQTTGSLCRFPWLGWGSPLYFLARGYAVLEGPAMPVLGTGGDEPNDTFVEQIVSGAEAAVCALVARGVGERGRIAIGGHSYGAFLAVNLLAHTDYFCAGIARTGAYNRTLTPFGFQSEERSLWDARNVYLRVSPLLHAETIRAPLLIIHGLADNNPGTHTLQSEMLYNALKGLGRRARLVLLPAESHQYRFRESILHALSEMSEWLDEYCKRM